jgi:hypothetical protein
MCHTSWFETALKKRLLTMRVISQRDCSVVVAFNHTDAEGSESRLKAGTTRRSAGGLAAPKPRLRATARQARGEGGNYHQIRRLFSL